MEEIIIKRPILGLSSSYSKLLATCCCFPVIVLIDISGIEVRKLPLPLFMFGFMGSIFLLYMVIKKILMIPKRTYLTMTDDRIIVHDKRGQWEERFDKVDSFEQFSKSRG